VFQPYSAVTDMASFGPQSIYLTIAQQADMEDGGTIMSQSRRLAAILAADIAGYSALMGSDEARTVSDLKGPSGGCAADGWRVWRTCH